MTDRELLALAAKAAAIPLGYWNDGTEPYSSGTGFVLPSNAIWNPLTGCGDALRLAVKLGINIYLAEEGFVMAGKFGIQGFRAELSADPDKAVRHMIVRAAAEIGKAMP